MQLDLLLDGTGVVGEPGSIGDRCSTALLELTKFQGETHQPYYVHAYWGRFSFRGILTQADVTYTLFDRAGEPLRATVKLSFKEALSPEEVAAKDRPASPDLYQTWLVSDGDPLDAIAAKVYGDPAYWRPLAAGQPAHQPARPEDRSGAAAPAAGGRPMAACPADRPDFEVRVGGTPLEPLVAADVIELDVHEEVNRHGRLSLLVQNWDADTARRAAQRRRAVHPWGRRSRSPSATTPS